MSALALQLSRAIGLRLLCLPWLSSAAGQQPTVRVVAPEPTNGIPVGQNFRVAAEAQADAGRRIVKVEFFVWSHNLRVGEAASATWTAEVMPRDTFARARFSLIARATDDSGAATSPVKRIGHNGNYFHFSLGQAVDCADDLRWRRLQARPAPGLRQGPQLSAAQPLRLDAATHGHRDRQVRVLHRHVPLLGDGVGEVSLPT